MDTEGRTATSIMTLHVGEPAPTLLSTAFSADNQNTTFFILGLIVTALGAVVGVVRARRKRSRFLREMRKLDEDFAATRRDPRRCERVLAESKAHARALATSGALDEGHAELLADRADEHLRTLRLGELESDLHFLPYGIVLGIQEMLADGRITRLERDHFILALEQAEIQPDHKERLKRLIQAWSDRDNATPRVEASP
jgi:hypothetical protein